ADADAARSVIAASDVLLMQLENPLETVTRAAAIAREAGTTVILNAAPAQPVPSYLLADLDAIIMNEEEAQAVCVRCALDDHRAAAQTLSALGPRCAVVTLGPRGALAVVDGQPSRIEPFAAKPIDTVGAGDAFCGTFACRWAEQQVRGGLDPMGIID